MPIYEYQCQKCHHHLEALQKISDKPLRECPECGKHTLQRLMSAPMFRLVGSGWYETDFKSDKENKRNLAGKDEAPAAESAAGQLFDGNLRENSRLCGSLPGSVCGDFPGRHLCLASLWPGSL